jgi:DNA (cytosine-5)-methyltransferase 1
MAKKDSRIPIIDLFAGPGGLGEGFSRLPVGTPEKAFRIALSIEKDPYAHRTLTTRAFFRQFPEGQAPPEYYAYLRGEITRDDLFANYKQQASHAQEEAQLRTLGMDPEIPSLIKNAIKGHKTWILIGGPPCQAYSLAGRSRMLGLVQQPGEKDHAFAARKKANATKFDGDHRHTLYKEYLKVIADHSPPVFVMENVKGILSAKLKGESIFPQILADLKDPIKALDRRGKGPSYRIHSLVIPTSSPDQDLEPRDYLIRAEDYGVPQTRHRVILVGVRDDIKAVPACLKPVARATTVADTIDDLPRLTSGLSKGSGATPYQALAEILTQPWWAKLSQDENLRQVVSRMTTALQNTRITEARGSQFAATKNQSASKWYHDLRLGGVCNHETRSHIREDLWRYLFCASFAEEGRSPVLRDFPTCLLPNHANVESAIDGQKFGDRFRVQCKARPATTITSHISKDGHYFIHYDPRQCRSLTVREAARLQTFPDNYFFEGPRTQQFHQVGNAVPPLLAIQIAAVVQRILT